MSQIPSHEPLLTASGLTYTYGSLVALRDISFFLSAGELVAVVGRNGAGKSTLLRCLAGWTRASGGEILLGGVPIYRDERAAIAVTAAAVAASPHITSE